MRDFSYGIIPMRNGLHGWEVLVVFHRKGFWGFPKGHSENLETHQQAAERELFEETGLKVVRYLSEQEFIEHYQFTHKGQRIDKRVTFFVAEVNGELNLEADELSDAHWLPLQQVHQELTYPESQAIIRRVQTLF